MADGFSGATRQCQQEGFALVPGVVPVDDIDAVAGDLARLYGSDTFDDYNRTQGFGDGEELRRFRAAGQQPRVADFVWGKSPDDLALFGIPRPGHAYRTAATVDAMAVKYPGVDVSPWLVALS